MNLHKMKSLCSCLTSLSSMRLVCWRQIIIPGGDSHTLICFLLFIVKLAIIYIVMSPSLHLFVVVVVVVGKGWKHFIYLFHFYFY